MLLFVEAPHEGLMLEQADGIFDCPENRFCIWAHDV